MSLEKELCIEGSKKEQLVAYNGYLDIYSLDDC